MSDRFLAEAAKYPGLDVLKAAAAWNEFRPEDVAKFLAGYAAEHGLAQGKAADKDEETKKAEATKPEPPKAPSRRTR